MAEAAVPASAAAEVPAAKKAAPTVPSRFTAVLSLPAPRAENIPAPVSEAVRKPTRVAPSGSSAATLRLRAHQVPESVPVQQATLKPLRSSAEPLPLPLRRGVPVSAAAVKAAQERSPSKMPMLQRSRPTTVTKMITSRD